MVSVWLAVGAAVLVILRGRNNAGRYTCSKFRLCEKRPQGENTIKYDFCWPIFEGVFLGKTKWWRSVFLFDAVSLYYSAERERKHSLSAGRSSYPLTKAYSTAMQVFNDVLGLFYGSRSFVERRLRGKCCSR
ncbi:hypothetical protein PF004_g28730 [Phytophthora fragariae]|uniref:PiggyBac transposable element-derived protein domain-containing protein n=1 Tax=Phytophthora fragariae TaxID=53985 RepID=A0A6A3GZJ7_9STRA|nr:hypothetical protein PF011_g29454 [Phytophthora fragariae]KAE9167706.1 hypothetical protein PF004_g28730 [Phytophthora fragariae]